MSLLAQLDQKIAANGGLIVSCQPVPDSPLDKPEIVAAMALAAEQAGAVAIRIEGVANLQATRAVVSVPIIGIVKRDLEDSPVRVSRPILKMLMRWRRRARTLSPLTAPTARVRCLLKRCWHVFTITVYWR